MGYTMKRINKLIIANLVVIIIGIIIITSNMFIGGPSLESGSRDILVLAGEADEQPGGSVDMAYMVHLENGSFSNFTPIYPGGKAHPSKAAPGGLSGRMLMHDCLWNGVDEGVENAKEIVEYNTGMKADAVVIIRADAADAIVDSIRPIYVDGQESNLSAVDVIRSNDAYNGYAGNSKVTGTMSRSDAVMVLVKAVTNAMKDPKKKEKLISEAMNQYNQGNIIMRPEGSFMRLLSTKGLEKITD